MIMMVVAEVVLIDNVVITGYFIINHILLMVLIGEPCCNSEKG